MIQLDKCPICDKPFNGPQCSVNEQDHHFSKWVKSAGYTYTFIFNNERFIFRSSKEKSVSTLHQRNPGNYSEAALFEINDFWEPDKELINKTKRLVKLQTFL
jgi:hypothetical protein